MRESKSHSFRLADPDARVIKDRQRRFVARETESFQRWAEYRKHKHVVQDAVAKRVFGDKPIDRKTKASLDWLRASSSSRAVPIRDAIWAGPPVFHVHPGINLLGPPYDFGLSVALGSNKPAIIIDVKTGRFAVVATASAGTNTFGSAGVALFVVPSDPARTLSIRPYFEWNYHYSCESHGSPTAHSIGSVSAEVSGKSAGKSMQLWSAGSDLWDDASGGGADTFRAPDSELIVSGDDHYVVSYVCQVTADSAAITGFGWFSESFVQLHCRVPFLVVEEF